MLTRLGVLLTLLRCCCGALVNTSSGPVSGLDELFSTGNDSRRVLSFLGIPYAQPPVGSLRFQLPRPPQNWTSVLNATRKSNACYQPVDTMYTQGFPYDAVNMWNPNSNISEDCLYLNVWTPAERTALLPVMVWIYGGSFLTGTAALDVYDGRMLATSQNVVVASMQYRLSLFGFLYLNSSQVPGNAGLADQQLALIWIQENARAFGGDPERITLFGESAGAASVSYQLLINRNRRPALFHSAVLQSASALGTWAYFPPQVLMQTSRSISACAGCHDNQTCLLQVDAETLLSCQSRLPVVHNMMLISVAPTADFNGLVSDSPAQLMLDGKFMKVPVLLGVCLNEASYFLLYNINSSLINYTCPKDALSNNTLLTYLKMILQYPNANDSLIAAQAESLAQQYLLSSVPTASNTSCVADRNLAVVEDVFGDGFLKCPTVEMANFYADSQQPVFFYQFQRRTASNPWPLWAGVLHGDEIDYIFGMPMVQPNRFTDEERQLSKLMQTAWANFARTRDPSVSGSLDWPMYSKSSGTFVYLDGETARGKDKVRVSSGIRKTQCQFLSQFSQFSQFTKFQLQRASSSSLSSTMNESWKIVLYSCVLVIGLVV